MARVETKISVKAFRAPVDKKYKVGGEFVQAKKGDWIFMDDKADENGTAAKNVMTPAEFEKAGWKPADEHKEFKPEGSTSIEVSAGEVLDLRACESVVRAKCPGFKFQKVEGKPTLSLLVVKDDKQK